MKAILLLINLIFTFSLMAKNPTVVLETTSGNIELEIFKDKAPKSSENFLSYVKSAHYDGTIFHRVIDGFMVQGGGFDANLKKKPTKAEIANEADNGLRNEIGTLAMARTREPNSATAQFFINVADNTFLNHSSKTRSGWGYAVFGKVIKGMSVVNKIKKAATTKNGPFQNLPTENISIKKAYIKEK